MRWATLRQYVAAVGTAVLCQAACGGDDPGCDIGDRQGVYLQQMTQRPGGTCGAVPDEVIDVRSGGASESAMACQERVPDELSDASCQLTRSLSCSVPGGGTTTILAVTTDIYGDGSVFEGTMTVTVVDPVYGDCRSTYDLRMERL